MQDEIELLHMILKNCFGNIFVIDKDANIVYVNDNAANALGLPAEELMRMSAYELLDRKLASSVAALKVLETKQEHIQAVTFANGNTMAVNARPVFDENGDIKNVVVFSQEQKVIEHFMQSIQHENQVISQTLSHVLQDSENNELIAVSDTIKHCLMMAKIAAYRESTIMLYGESGAGKEVIARYVHQNSQRNKKIFLPVNCAAIPHELMESEFFGYEKGAFTDARKAKAGRMEVASGGTLFLDEIGNLSLPMQAKLLTAIEKRQISRLGATDIIPIDVRLISATNVNIRELVEEGNFRQDLLYRINTIEITIPPLRERGEDVLLLADYFLQRYTHKYKKEINGLSREAKQKLMRYHWPGNVRELQHAIERAIILSDSPLLKPANFMLQPQPEKRVNTDEILNLEQLERNAIERAMKRSEGNLSRAAEYLGITRYALYRKLEKLGL